ncbi:MAG TPA: RidA family protein [Acidimicrobiia bacterium]|jgi:enamine deaminase RidA (YjgF/YER057c/UK114 family)
MRRSVGSGSRWEEAYGYSRAVRVGSVIKVSGTLAVARLGEETVDGAYEQMLRCGEITLDAVTRLGGSVTDVVRTRMFITDPADADDVGRAHAALFADVRPAATMVVVAALVEPAYKVELELEAIVDTA